jgi:hypothetical protein
VCVVHPATYFLQDSFSPRSRHLLAYVDVYDLGSSVGYVLNDRGSISDRYLSLHPEQHWCPPNLLSSWYLVSPSSFDGKAAWA